MTDGLDFSHLSRLVDCSVREAWAHEAHHFTVWLSQNLDRLGDVLGITLELDATEARIGTFYADILARDVEAEEGADRVLIENQLEPSNHGHLGQIMTYLAGSKASTVVWIAPAYREEHLAAIEWLNESTSTGFSFFAIKLRAVRIGDSAIAPLFDVAAKPNDWERRTKAAVLEAERESETTKRRVAYWDRFLELFPDMADRGMAPSGTTSQWLVPEQAKGLRLSLYRSVEEAGVFLRGTRGVKAAEIFSLYAPRAEAFAAAVGGVGFGGTDEHHPGISAKFDMTSPEGVDAAIRWQHDTAVVWLKAIDDLFGDTE